jgi:hypothetical protein
LQIGFDAFNRAGINEKDIIVTVHLLLTL